MAEIYSETSNGCPFVIASVEWYYLYNNVWTSAGPNEIKLECLKGNFPRYIIVSIFAKKDEGGSSKKFER